MLTILMGRAKSGKSEWMLRRIAALGDSSRQVLLVPECDALLLPIPEIIPLQLFAYYVAKFNGCDIDKPKNLAKSVTVE